MKPYNTFYHNDFHLSLLFTHRHKCLHAYNNFMIEVWTDPLSLAATKGMDSLFVPTQRALWVKT